MNLNIFLFLSLIAMAIAIIYLVIEISRLKNWIIINREDLRAIFQNVNSVSANLGQLLERTDRSGESLSARLSEFRAKLDEIQRTAEAAKELKEMLKAPKGKGAFGEFSLYSLVSDSLPSGAYEFQYRLKNGSVVDLAIKIDNRILPVDSKFPYDRFACFITETDELKRKNGAAELKRAVKAHVDDISKKYINPSENTFDFALMFLPSEALYYEITCNKDFEDLYTHFREKNVYPVSPNTFYIYLAGIGYVLKQLHFEKNYEEVLDAFKSLELILKNLASEMKTLGNHLKNASSSLSRVDSIVRDLEKQILKVCGLKDKK